MKVYTRTGDDGTTGLFGGGRVSKADARVDVYGTIDELNSVVGVVRTCAPPDDVDALLADMQSELFDLGAELACVPGKDAKLTTPRVGEDQIVRMERFIDRLDDELPPLTTFILPGGSPAAAHLHHARTVCRRAERGLVGLSAHEPVRADAVRYLNRVSDLLFVMARACNARAGLSDVPWRGRGR